MQETVDGQTSRGVEACAESATHRCGSAQFVRHHAWPEHILARRTLLDSVRIEIIEVLVETGREMPLAILYDFMREEPPDNLDAADERLRLHEIGLEQEGEIIVGGG